MKILIIGLAFLAFDCRAQAERKEVVWGGFIDTYYGFDFSGPGGDRAFTTQAARHNEFGINLAYVEAKIEKDRVRGRLALQGGTSVYINYAGERAAQSVFGTLVQHIQEAYGGYRIREGLWLDAGIFLSHIGAETFISRDNWNYTRSLGADYSPYYQTGARLTYQWNPQWNTSIHLMNGWQNIIETNPDKAVGIQVSYAPCNDYSFTYNNFIGREQELRFFNNLILKARIAHRWWASFSSDVGLQRNSATGGTSTWYVETLLTQFRLTETLALGGRVEYFHDADQVVVSTGTPNGFQTFGASLNLDWQPESSILIRNELRSLFSRDSVFSNASGERTSNTLFVTSLGLSF